MHAQKGKLRIGQFGGGFTSHPLRAGLLLSVLCSRSPQRNPLGKSSVKEKKTGNLLAHAPGVEVRSLILVRAVAHTSLVTSDLFLRLCFASCDMGVAPASTVRVRYPHVGGVPGLFSFPFVGCGSSPA